VIAPFDFSWLPQSFREKQVPRAQKERFSKNKKNTPRHSSKPQMCQISA